MNRKIVLATLLLLSCIAVKLPISEGVTLTGSDEATIVFVEPRNITGKVDEVFTVSVKVERVINLYSLSINFSWDPSILDYQNHQVKIPVENYPEGVLHEPVNFTNIVNAKDGKYQINGFSSDPAPAFNGTGTIFEMTFKVRKDLGVLPDWSIERSSCLLTIGFSVLADKEGNPIQHEIQNGRFKVLYATVRVHPQSVSASRGDAITVSVVIENLYDGAVKGYLGSLSPLGNLYGLDIKLSWNPTVLEYISHKVTIPVQDYPDTIPPSPYPGILHKPVFEVIDKVDATAGTYRIAYASVLPATVFNGNGTVFTIALKVVKRGASYLRLTEVELCDYYLRKQICYQSEDGYFGSPGAPVADFTFWPKTPVVNKTLTFNASASYSPLGLMITKYVWHFGDGTMENTTDPVIEYSYSSIGPYDVALIVMDGEGILSAAEMEEISIVRERDVEIYWIRVSAERVLLGREVAIDVTVYNGGEASENFTVTAYYNQTTWIEIDEQDVTNLEPGRFQHLIFKWNTTGVTPETYYAIRVSASRVPHEENIVNNDVVAETLVFVTAGEVHDVAIIDVIPSMKEVYVGWIVNIKVTAINNGTVEENLNVTVYFDENPIETQAVFLSLLWRAHLSFSWNTTGVTPGNYTIRAEASIVPVEENFENNIFVNGVVRVIHILGDINCDGRVNVYDVVMACAAYGSKEGDSNWNPVADLARPWGIINIYDIVTITCYFGKTYP